jgi:hypothetical protein
MKPSPERDTDKKEKKLDYVFLDYENIPLQAIPDHSGIKMVFLFLGEKQDKVPVEILESVQKLGPKAKVIRIKGSGKNALDFHIAYYIGRYAKIDPKGTFKILSKDKGFDPLVEHLRSEKIDCVRLETLAVKAINNAGLKEWIGALGKHFQELNEKARPKKDSRLKAYIKNRTREESAFVNEVVQGLIAKGHLAIEAGKVKYFEAG